MIISKAHWNSDGDNLRLSMPFSKVDKERRIVSGFASLDNIDKQEIIKRFQKYTFVGYKSEPIENNNTGLSDIELKEFIINLKKSNGRSKRRINCITRSKRRLMHLR